MSLSYVGKPEYPPTVIDSINAKVTANQKTLQREQEVKQREAEANMLRAEAAGQADAIRTKARLKPTPFVYAAKLCARIPALWSWKRLTNGTARYRNT